MQKKTILIIDDEESICRMLKLNLEEHEYQCVTTTAGKEGIEHVKRHKPDLVLLDIMMPGMNGIEVLKRIKEIDKDVPVCMVTAVWNEAEAKRCFAAGAYDYLGKPIDFDYLKMSVFVRLYG